jgi:uncharacterized protein (DUF2236 family)
MSAQTARSPSASVHPAAEEHVVTDAAFESALAGLAARCDRDAGLFGPGSMMWMVGRETALILGGTRSVLQQLAHPFVSASLKYVSGPGRNVRQRFIRTMHYCTALTFGNREEVMTAARKIFAIHGRVDAHLDRAAGVFPRGTRFRANEVDALWWVAATLWDSSVVAFETLVRPLTLDEKNAFLDDARRWSGLFGIPESAMSPDWPSFERYVREMTASDVLTVTDLGRHAARRIFQSPRRVTAPLYAWNRILTTGLLPPRLRREFDLPYGPREQRLFRRSVRCLGPVFRHVPGPLRYNPVYMRATRRLNGTTSGHPVSEAMVRLVLATLG